MVFAFGEIDPRLSDDVILIADHHRGEPLSATDGALALIVVGDKRPARWVSHLQRLRVMDASK